MTSIIPQTILLSIRFSKLGYGQFELLDDRKFVFFPNHERGGYNPTHIFNLGNKIGQQIAEKKISFLEKVFLQGGRADRHGGEIAVFVYKIRNLKKEKEA